MQITCPSCSTRYEIGLAALGDVGRRVRCKRCGHLWFQTPEADDAAGRDAETFDQDGGGHQDESEIGRPRAAAWADGFDARRSEDLSGFDSPDQDGDSGTLIGFGADNADFDDAAPPDRRRSWVGWAVLAGGVACLVAGFVLLRTPLVSAWPPALKVYDALALPVALPGDGLEIRNVEAAASMESGERVLVLEGQVHNISDQERMVPEISAHGVNAGVETESWQIPPTPMRLLPGEIATFYSYRRNPGEISEIVVTFTRG